MLQKVPEYILGADRGRVEIESILESMRSSFLYDKPVLIFVQACAGSKLLLHLALNQHFETLSPPSLPLECMLRFEMFS